MASEHFFFRARASSRAEHVWEQLQKPSTWGRIGGVDRLNEERFDDNGDLFGYRFVIIVGGSEYHGTATRKDAVPDKQMAMEIDSPHVTGEIGVVLDPEGDGTWVAVSLSMASKGLLSSMLFPLMVKAVAAGFEAAAADFVNSLSR